MKRYRGAYLLIAGLAVAGCALLLADMGESSAAVDYVNAVACPDTSSSHCYQLYPGVINSVRVVQTSSGQEDEVVIASQGTTVKPSLKPTGSDAGLVVVGAEVTVEWYVGFVAAVHIGGHPIPTTSNPSAYHGDFAFVGWILIWLAAACGAVMLVSRLMARDYLMQLASIAVRAPSGAPGSQVVLPAGTTGWAVKPRIRAAVFLPLALALIALISVRPLMNPVLAPVELISDSLLLAAVFIRLVLTLRNSRLMADRNAIMKVDWLGRVRTWPLAEIDQATVFSLRSRYANVLCLAFIGRDGSELLSFSGLWWDIGQIGALCTLIGFPPTDDYYETRSRPVNRKQRAAVLAVSMVFGALLLVSFLPLPAAH